MLKTFPWYVTIFHKKQTWIHFTCSLVNQLVRKMICIDAKLDHTYLSHDLSILFYFICCIHTNTHLNFAVVYYLTIHFKISTCNSCKEKMDTGICRLWCLKQNVKSIRSPVTFITEQKATVNMHSELKVLRSNLTTDKQFYSHKIHTSEVFLFLVVY